MKRSIYIYNEGDLLRRDNTLRFVPEDGEPRNIPIEAVQDVYVMCEMNF